MSSASSIAEVIDWDEAMQQCGEDEEFLRELLADLRSETDTQMAKIEETIRNPTDSPFVQIMRASHVIKGAASNLMCGQLRQTAMNLESAASMAASDPNGSNNASVLQPVQARYEELKVAVANYHAYLQSVGV
ncbi:Hpt domain containing protein [Nitzschia inconspicua]|uniref:Hpt domain containing protein n=1 Tax=Nitzschia inconspicua TaxID=303405 RepID=A0A9K3LDZ4_9STRA|nr:Hpt domain containing protein [Nitzschia inconspicua]